jgi:hypothetical protein
MLSEVDVCEVVLGEPWRLPTEADLTAIPEAEVEALRKHPGFYFASKFYVRTKDGLAEGSLESRGVRPLTSPAGKVVPGRHLEGGIGVRCFRGSGPERPPRNDRAPGWVCDRQAAKAKPAPPPMIHPPQPDPASPTVEAFSHYGDRHVGGSRGLDVAETYRQIDLIRADYERAVQVLAEPEPVNDPHWKAWRNAKRDEWLIRYALQKLDSRIDRERQQPGPPDPRTGKRSPYGTVAKARIRELDKLQKVIASLLAVSGR